MGSRSSVMTPKADGKAFRLVSAADATQAIHFNARFDINDRWNVYAGSVRLGPKADSATFKFARDGKHVSYVGDEFLGIDINGCGVGQVVEGGSCQLIRAQNKGQGQSGSPFVQNEDGTISPARGNKGLVLGFGPITYDSWRKKPQAADSIGGLSWQHLGLVARNSPNRLLVEEYVPPKADDKAFRLVAADDKTQAIHFNARFDINDQWNVYAGSVRLGPKADSSTFKFALDGKHVSYVGDEFLGIDINGCGVGQVVEGGSCQLIRAQNKGQGESGSLFVQNEDGTISPADGNTNGLVLGYGLITYDSWQRKPQAGDSIGGLSWQHLSLVSRDSAKRLLVEATVPNINEDNIQSFQ